MRLSGACFATLLLMAAPAAAQDSGIAGAVNDNTGGVLPGVTVEAASPALIEGSRIAVTDAQGRYAFTALRPGVYTVTFTLTGFTTVIREGIELTAGFTAPVNVELGRRRPRGDHHRLRPVAGHRRPAGAGADGRHQRRAERPADEQGLGRHRGPDGRRRPRVAGRRRRPRIVHAVSGRPRRRHPRRHAPDGRADDGQPVVRLLVHDPERQRRPDRGAHLRDRGGLGRRGHRRGPREHHPEGGRQLVQRIDLRQLLEQRTAGRQPQPGPARRRAADAGRRQQHLGHQRRSRGADRQGQAVVPRRVPQLGPQAAARQHVLRHRSQRLRLHAGPDAAGHRRAVRPERQHPAHVAGHARATSSPSTTTGRRATARSRASRTGAHPRRRATSGTP